jgi:hypothetical protein
MTKFLEYVIYYSLALLDYNLGNLRNEITKSKVAHPKAKNLVHPINSTQSRKSKMLGIVRLLHKYGFEPCCFEVLIFHGFTHSTQIYWLNNHDLFNYVCIGFTSTI